MARSFIQGGISKPGSIWGPDQTPSALDSSRAVSAVGANVTRIGGGVSLFVPRSRLAAIQQFPLQTVIAITGTDNITTTGIQVVYGTIAAEVPSIDGIALKPILVSSPYLVVDSTITTIYFELDFTNGLPNDVPQIYGGSIPEDTISGGTGSAYREIAGLAWSGGMLMGISPTVLYSLGYDLCGDQAQFYAGI